MDKRSSNVRQDPVMQASEFFVEFRAGDATPGVRARFQKWLRSSPENVKAYLEIAAGWSELPTVDPEGLINVQALLAEAQDARDDKVIQLGLGRAKRAPHSPPYHARIWGLAGSLALLMIALVGTGVWVITQGELTYKTGIGEQRTLILADGSTVMLNALTTVRVHMSQDVRQIMLTRGQAYFHDIDDPKRPFIVSAGKSAVRAIGTEFDVEKRPDRTIVTVIEGSVAVATLSPGIASMERRERLDDLAAPVHDLRAVFVSAGEQVSVLTQNIPTPNPVDVTAVTAWMQQRLVFDDTPLETVAQQFNLYSRRRLVIADSSLRNVGVSGEYSASDPSALIGFLRSQPTLHVVETSNEFRVTRK